MPIRQGYSDYGGTWSGSGFNNFMMGWNYGSMLPYLGGLKAFGFGAAIALLRNGNDIGAVSKEYMVIDKKTFDGKGQGVGNFVGRMRLKYRKPDTLGPKVDKAVVRIFAQPR
jgi:hypothetical protein